MKSYIGRRFIALLVNLGRTISYKTHTKRKCNYSTLLGLAVGSSYLIITMYTLNVDLSKKYNVTILGGWENDRGEQIRAKLPYPIIKITKQYKKAIKARNAT